MQSVDHSGILGKPEKFNPKRVEKMLENPDIDHVDVFPNTKENIEHRTKLIGKKYTTSKKYKKVKRL